jgi:hypothetical protein
MLLANLISGQVLTLPAFCPGLCAFFRLLKAYPPAASHKQP